MIQTSDIRDVLPDECGGGEFQVQTELSGLYGHHVRGL